MKREGSRFTIDELNIVISNWEQIANEFNGNFKLLNTCVDDRSPALRAINSKNIDHIKTILFRIEVRIPFLNDFILITSGESVPTKFSYKMASKEFSFSISNEDFFDKIEKLFGSKEPQINQLEFDKKFLLETNNNDKLKDFLDFKTRNWLESLSIAYFDLNTIKSKDGLCLFFSFNELSLDKIRPHIEMFKYCISKLKTL